MRKTLAFTAWAAACALGVATFPAVAQQKQSVSKVVAKPLQAAQAAIKASKWSECISQLRQADAAAGKTPYDDFAVAELLGFCAIRVNDYGTAARSLEKGLESGFLPQDQVSGRIRALSQVNYQIKNYAKSIEFGNRAIKGGFADADMYTLVAQAYYIQGDYKTSRKFIEDWVSGQEERGQAPREGALQLLLSSCVKLEDDTCTSRTLERLVARYPKDEYWQNLMRSLFRSGGSDKTMLNVYRLATEVNAMRRGDDYTEMAQLAIEQGMPGEAQAALEAAFEKKFFTDARDVERNQRLLATAKQQSATDRGTLARQEKDAAAAKTGEAELRVGQAYISYGQIPQGLAAVQRGIAKGGLKNPAEAQLVLGIAHLRAGNKAEAVKAFKAVKGDETLARLGNLWALRAQ
jgi:hypothetical protein